MDGRASADGGAGAAKSMKATAAVAAERLGAAASRLTGGGAVAAAWPPRGGWAALAVFWLCVFGAAGGTAGVLAWLGPPDTAQTVAVAPAPAAPVATNTPGAVPERVAAPAADPAPAPSSVQRSSASVGRSPGGAVEPALQEAGPHGPLPRVGPDGRTPIRAYGHPFDRSDTRPRVGLIVGGLGMNAAVTEEAIRRLPPAVTLAFSPYATRVDFLLDQVRAKGGETVHGNELWITDGTPDGTRLVEDINRNVQGYANSVPSYFAALEGGRVVFMADDGANGAEPWISDGTPEGTQLLRNINPGAAGSGAFGFVSVSSADGAYDPVAPAQSPPVADGWLGA